MTGRLLERDISLTRFPAPARRAEYEQASEKIDDLLRRLPGIIAIYRTGSVSVPGISDVDRIAVVESKTTVPSIWHQLSERARYLAMHGPFLSDLATFRRHRWFAHVEPLDLSFGTAVELEDRPLPEYSEPLIAAESMVISLLSTVKQVSTGVFKVRPSLCQLNNLRHALALARLDDVDAPQAWKLTRDVASVRNTWFESAEADRTGLVRDVAARSVPALLEALRALGQRSESANVVAGEVRLGAPWGNVVLTSSEGDRVPIDGAPRPGLPFMRTVRVADVRWRAARPRIALPPAVLTLLTGTRRRQEAEEEDFRSKRDALVRAYRDFISEEGRGYAEIGLASPFLSAPKRRSE